MHCIFTFSHSCAQNITRLAQRCGIWNTPSVGSLLEFDSVACIFLPPRLCSPLLASCIMKPSVCSGLFSLPMMKESPPQLTAVQQKAPRSSHCAVIQVLNSHHNWTGHVECFTYSWDAFPLSIWETVHERWLGSFLKLNLKEGCTNAVCLSNAKQATLLRMRKFSRVLTKLLRVQHPRWSL